MSGQIRRAALAAGQMLAKRGTAVRAGLAGVVLLLELPLLLPVFAGALITGAIARLFQLTRRADDPAVRGDRR
jgi:hypothetical protein